MKKTKAQIIDELELPLLLVLDRSMPQSPDEIRAKVDPHAYKPILDSALRELSSRGLCLRSSEYQSPKFTGLRVIQGKDILRWRLSERGMAWRDRRIAAGHLERLPPKYAKVAEPWRIRAETLDGLEREVSHA